MREIFKIMGLACICLGSALSILYLRDSYELEGWDLERNTALIIFGAIVLSRLWDKLSELVFGPEEEESSRGKVEVIRPESSELPLIGAPTAAIDWTKTTLAVDALRDRVQYPWRHSRATLKANIAAINALSLHTAIMYMAVIASRGNRHLSSTTYRHFAMPDSTSAHGIALSYDKGAGFALDCRVCAIPALLIEQVEALVIQTCRLIDKLKSKASSEHKALRERLEAVVEGRAPLFS